MTATVARPTAALAQEERVSRRVDELLAEAPPLTQEQITAAVAILSRRAAVVPRPNQSTSSPERRAAA